MPAIQYWFTGGALAAFLALLTTVSTLVSRGIAQPLPNLNRRQAELTPQSKDRKEKGSKTYLDEQ